LARTAPNTSDPSPLSKAAVAARCAACRLLAGAARYAGGGFIAEQAYHGHLQRQHYTYSLSDAVAKPSARWVRCGLTYGLVRRPRGAVRELPRARVEWPTGNGSVRRLEDWLRQKSPWPARRGCSNDCRLKLPIRNPVSVPRPAPFRFASVPQCGRCLQHRILQPQFHIWRPRFAGYVQALRETSARTGRRLRNQTHRPIWPR